MYFHSVKNNAGAIVAVWAPIILVSYSFILRVWCPRLLYQSYEPSTLGTHLSTIKKVDVQNQNIIFVVSFINHLIFFDTSLSYLIQVYFMDTQIWYSVFCTIFGGVYGIFHHLGEVSCLFFSWWFYGSGLTFLPLFRSVQWECCEADSSPCLLLSIVVLSRSHQKTREREI